MNSMWKILGTVALVLLAVSAAGIGKLVGKTATKNLFDGKRETEMRSTLMKAASKINENLPMMVDSETRLDATIGMNKQFRYNYTLMNYTAEDIDIPAFNEAMKPSLVNKVCTTEEMVEFMNYGVSVTYAYHGKNGKKFTAITIKPEFCNSI